MNARLESVFSARPVENPFSAWDLKILSMEQFAELNAGDSETNLSESQLEYLGHFGLLAPTSHNTVPQRYRFAKDGKLEIWLDRCAVLPASDVDGRQATVSIGCVIGQIMLAAKCYGLEPNLQICDVSAKQTLPFKEGEDSEDFDCRYIKMAEIEFKPGAREIAGREWLEAMLERRMVRAEYDRSPLEAGIAERMLELISEKYNLGLHVLADTPSLFFLGKFQEAADSYVMNKKIFSRELGDWLLPNDSPSSLGMRGREFGLSDALSQRIHNGLVGKGPLMADEVANFAKANGLGMRSASAAAVITVEKDDVANRIDAGRAFVDLALLLTRNGLVTSMQAGVTEVASAGFAMKSRLMTTGRPTVVFRIGRPIRGEDLNRPHSARPQTAQIRL